MQAGENLSAHGYFSTKVQTLDASAWILIQSLQFLRKIYLLLTQMLFLAKNSLLNPGILVLDQCGQAQSYAAAHVGFPSSGILPNPMWKRFGTAMGDVCVLATLARLINFAT